MAVEKEQPDLVPREWDYEKDHCQCHRTVAVRSPVQYPNVVDSAPLVLFPDNNRLAGLGSVLDVPHWQRWLCSAVLTEAFVALLAGEEHRGDAMV